MAGRAAERATPHEDVGSKRALFSMSDTPGLALAQHRRTRYRSASRGAGSRQGRTMTHALPVLWRQYVTELRVSRLHERCPGLHPLGQHSWPRENGRGSTVQVGPPQAHPPRTSTVRGHGGETIGRAQPPKPRHPLDRALRRPPGRRDYKPPPLELRARCWAHGVHRQGQQAEIGRSAGEASSRHPTISRGHGWPATAGVGPP
jgi:hypothetical protein